MALDGQASGADNDTPKNEGAPAARKDSGLELAVTPEQARKERAERAKSAEDRERQQVAEAYKESLAAGRAYQQQVHEGAQRIEQAAASTGDALTGDEKKESDAIVSEADSAEKRYEDSLAMFVRPDGGLTKAGMEQRLAEDSVKWVEPQKDAAQQMAEATAVPLSRASFDAALATDAQRWSEDSANPDNIARPIPARESAAGAGAAKAESAKSSAGAAPKAERTAKEIRASVKEHGKDLRAFATDMRASREKLAKAEAALKKYEGLGRLRAVTPEGRIKRAELQADAEAAKQEYESKRANYVGETVYRKNKEAMLLADAKGAERAKERGISEKVYDAYKKLGETPIHNWKPENKALAIVARGLNVRTAVSAGLLVGGIALGGGAGAIGALTLRRLMGGAGASFGAHDLMKMWSGREKAVSASQVAAMSASDLRRRMDTLQAKAMLGGRPLVARGRTKDGGYAASNEEYLRIKAELGRRERSGVDPARVTENMRQMLADDDAKLAARLQYEKNADRKRKALAGAVGALVGSGAVAEALQNTVEWARGGDVAAKYAGETVADRATERGSGVVAASAETAAPTAELPPQPPMDAVIPAEAAPTNEPIMSVLDADVASGAQQEMAREISVAQLALAEVRPGDDYAAIITRQLEADPARYGFDASSDGDAAGWARKTADAVLRENGLVSDEARMRLDFTGEGKSFVVLHEDLRITNADVAHHVESAPGAPSAEEIVDEATEQAKAGFGEAAPSKIAEATPAEAVAWATGAPDAEPPVVDTDIADAAKEAVVEKVAGKMPDLRVPGGNMHFRYGMDGKVLGAALTEKYAGAHFKTMLRADWRQLAEGRGLAPDAVEGKLYAAARNLDSYATAHAQLVENGLGDSQEAGFLAEKIAKERALITSAYGDVFTADRAGSLFDQDLAEAVAIEDAKVPETIGSPERGALHFEYDGNGDVKAMRLEYTGAPPNTGELLAPDFMEQAYAKNPGKDIALLRSTVESRVRTVIVEERILAGMEAQGSGDTAQAEYLRADIARKVGAMRQQFGEIFKR